MAKFYGIGTGPGDSDLLTIRGKKALETIDYLYTPEPKKKGKSLALSIVSPYLPDNLEIKQRHFPMVNDLSVKEEAWDLVASEILEDVKSGKNVGFVTLGDPMVYSTYSYLLERLSNAIETETIPGISSFSSMSNILQIPLVMDEETYSVVPATADESVIKTALETFSTVIIMKVSVELPKIKRLLESYDLLDSTVLISNASMENESIIMGLTDLDETKRISYFSTMIVYKTREI
ncbi:cobalt-factor II C(20)-methyltransferase [Vagococcus hydrophili]|uniref:Cobalt-factor II C(20)-methyltransferase n=1 Tax=Vagococcus hydrophili TaxID=2714947 RepID=A0A6G8AUJ0_9ENTE|nr:cobalt-factor II C(20)-methyltransferase [Vagococcus hydrophili]QIL48650.1 cobalt-factor II C(20)-methyltransferase [Vagococcus hydrophili]